MASSGSTQRFIEVEEEPNCCLKYITIIVRTWGILTAGALLGLSIRSLQADHTKYIGWYILGVAIVVTFFELTWLINKCACCDDRSCCCLIWRGIVWIDNWRKTLLYVALCIPCFLKGMKVLMGVVCGLILIVLALLYLVKSFKNVHCGKKKRNINYMEVTSPTVSLVQHEVSQPAEQDISHPSSPTKDQDSDTSYQGGQSPTSP
ncbi:uncharacterized protein LOC135485476 isoform X2 [Lineus longissimus]|uniref:uncharacterized protein LOC135485476 isoform X2 n=1 Tax=Lineus longissimus TaxID=88925 RepID=UPI00315CC88C